MQIQNPIILKKSTKNGGHSENMGFDGKTIWRFQTKKKLKYNSSLDQTTPSNTGPLNATIDMDPVTRKKYIEENLKKAFR